MALQKPTTVLGAIQLTIQSEEIVQLLTRGQRLVTKTPQALATINTKNEVMVPKPRISPVKRLTLEEMRARTEKNMCFNCDEVFRIGHKCKWLYLILMEGKEGEAEKTLELEVLKNDKKEHTFPLILR